MSNVSPRITDAERSRLCARVDIAQLIGSSLQLKKRGKNHVARCPFHDERSASFNVRNVGQFFHCYGCGKNGDALTWLIEYHGLDFIAACKTLDDRAFEKLEFKRPKAHIDEAPAPAYDTRLVPLMPVPDHAPALLGDDGWTVPIFNPGKDKTSRWKPTRADEYRNSRGLLLGYVLRSDFNGQKITPTVTWCARPDGSETWALCQFPPLRPLCGLFDLAQKPDAPAMVVEGEKCRAAGAGALSPYAVVTWPGGSNGLGGTRWHDATRGWHHLPPLVDWSPLAGRDVVLFPDADEPGRRVMLGHEDSSGRWHPGVVDFLVHAGVKSIRMIDVFDRPKGWDIADALDPEIDGWSPRQLAAWAKQRVVEIEIRR